MSKKQMTVEEFVIERTKIAISLINNSLEELNPKLLEKTVLEISSTDLPEIVNFIDNFTTKYPDPTFQNRIFAIVLNKLDVGHVSEKSNILKSEVLLAKAKAIMAINLTEERTQIKLEKATNALELLERANALQNHDITTLIENTVRTLITMHPNSLEAFNLAKYSVEFRKTHLEPYHPSILEAYITTAKAGHIIGERAIKIEAIQNADIAYNMALHLGNKTYAADALEFIASVYENFGDYHKASLLLKQSLFLKDIIVDKVEESKEQESPITIESLHIFEIIRKHGVSDDLTLTIKQKIQESVLNPVYTAAIQGKWINKIASIEYGVCGYLDGPFLSKSLGIALNTPENVNIALMLCFEAINLGIMNNPLNNPLCGVAFVEQYPELVPTILAQHPEYFVDGHILKATLINASDYAPELLGKEIAVNNSYNAYLETIMIPTIADRLNTRVLEPVSSLIKTGEWNSLTQNQLLAYASEEYLTAVGKIYTSTLGQNLSTLSDALNISRILIFKKILDTITESGSKNYAPVEVFAKNYTDVIKRILADHPDYIANPHIIDICQQSLIVVQQLSEDIDSGADMQEVPVLGINEVEMSS